MLDRNELDYIKEALNCYMDIEERYNTDKEYVGKREILAKGIIDKIKSLETISTINKKDCVSPFECFVEGMAGRCGFECRYHLFDGCEKAEEE